MSITFSRLPQLSCVLFLIGCQSCPVGVLAADHIPPQAQIVSPEDNATVAGSQVVFSVDAWDENGVRKVKFDVNGTLQAEITSEPFAWEWDTTGIEDGEHVLRARVYDRDYNRTDREVRVRVDNDRSGPPAWAGYAFDALQSYKQIVDYWVGRVAADTSTDYFNVGGGWNDDVELSQSLMAYWLLTGDDPLADLFRDMTDRIQEAPYVGYKPAPWTQPGDRRIEQGYGTVMLDADHSAEETTLVFPRLFLVDYGEPTTVELMTRLIWNFQDDMAAQFPGEQNWGQWVDTGMLMRSPRFNARNMDWCWRPSGDPICFAPQDTVNNFRATAPGLSLAWYYGPDHYFWQNGPAGFMRAHHAAWIEASLRADGSKPTLIPPSKILVPSLEFGDWTVNDADPSGGSHGWVEGAWMFRHFYHAMIANHLLFRDNGDTALREMAADADAIVYKAFSDRQYGRQVPIVNVNFALDRQFLQWRAEHGPTPEDDRFLSVRAAKSPNTRMMAYLIGVERGALVSALSHATDAYRQLSEYLAGKRSEWTTGLTEGGTGLTDRVKFEFSDAFLMAALGGGGIYDGAYPTIYYSLENTDAQVVTLTKNRDSRDTSFWIYNFGAERRIGLKLWRMKEGAGKVTLGPDRDQDGRMDEIEQELAVDPIRRGVEVSLTIPGGALYLVRIEVTDPRPRDFAALPDLAVGRKDYAYSNGTASVRVHNLGGSAVSAVVRLYDTAGISLGAEKIVDLPPFNTMESVAEVLTWEIADPDAVGWVVVDSAGQWEELTELNNVLTVNGEGSLPRP
jgi:Bacterial Ig domain